MSMFSVSSLNQHWIKSTCHSVFPNHHVNNKQHVWDHFHNNTVQEQTVALKPHQRCVQAFCNTPPSPPADMTNNFGSVQTLFTETTDLPHYLNNQWLPPVTVYQHSERTGEYCKWREEQKNNIERYVCTSLPKWAIWLFQKWLTSFPWTGTAMIKDY